MTLATAAACLLPPVASAELVATTHAPAVLAIAPGGTPTVAYLDGRTLVATTRTAAGWRPSRVKLPPLSADVVDIPEVAANDWGELDGWELDAALVASPATAPVELDGSIEGYAAVGTARQLLLATERGLEWFSAPRPAVHVFLGVDAAGHATGRVDGAAGGSVSIYRELPLTQRQLVASATIQPDGSFTAEVPVSSALYRAVYTDPATGIPYAARLLAPPVS